MVSVPLSFLGAWSPKYLQWERRWDGTVEKLEIWSPAELELPTLGACFSFHKMGTRGDLLYIKLSPGVDPEQGLEGQESQTGSSSPLGQNLGTPVKR